MFLVAVLSISSSFRATTSTVYSTQDWSPETGMPHLDAQLDRSALGAFAGEFYEALWICHVLAHERAPAFRPPIFANPSYGQRRPRP